MANKKFSDLDAASASLPLSTIVPVVEPSNIGIKATKSTVENVHTSVPFLLYFESSASDWDNLSTLQPYIQDIVKFQDYTILVKNTSENYISISNIGIAGLIDPKPIVKLVDGLVDNYSIEIEAGGMFMAKYVGEFSNGGWINAIGGGGTIPGAYNGITFTGSSYILGGDVEQATTLQGSGSNFTLQGFGRITLAGTQYLVNSSSWVEMTAATFMNIQANGTTASNLDFIAIQANGNGNTSNWVRLKTALITGTHVVQFPNKSGTIAMTSDITASNGLTRNVDDLKLGGSVAAPTNIVLDTGGTLGINSITNTKKFGLYTSANDTIGVVLDPTLISGNVKTQSYVNESGKISLSKRLHTTISHVAATDGIFEIIFNKFNGAMNASGGVLDSNDLGVYLVELQSYGIVSDTGTLKYGYTDSSYHTGYKADSSKFQVTAGESFAIKVSALYFISDVSGYNSGNAVRFKVENSGRVGDITNIANVFSGGTGMSVSATRIAYLSN